MVALNFDNEAVSNRLFTENELNKNKLLNVHSKMYNFPKKINSEILIFGCREQKIVYFILNDVKTKSRRV